MSYVRLYDLFPEIAMKETRTITVFQRNQYRIPPGEYNLIEMYCNDKGCDCRRAFIVVVSSVTNNAVATITFGWESKDFYAKWFIRDKKADYNKLNSIDQQAVDHMQGIHLNLISKQSEIAPAVLKMVTEQALQDKTYVNRLKRHYKLFKSKIDR